MTDNTPSVPKREFRRYEGEDSHPELEPTVAVKKTAVDFLMEEAKEDAELGIQHSPEDDTWKDRYGNLRRLSQNKDKQYKKDVKDREDRIVELETQLQQAKKMAGGFIPTTEAELNDWSRQNPEAYKIIRSIASGETTSEIEALKQEIEALRADFGEKEAEVARAKLEAKHPDLYEIAQDKKFWAWVDAQEDGPEIRSDLTNSFNVTKADRHLRTYKLEMGMTKENRPKAKDNRLAAALDVPAGGTLPNLEPNKPYLFRESDIKRMSDKDYEAKEAEITAAYLAGKVFLDLSNRATMRA